MAERNAAAGNLAIGKQTNPTTPVTPTVLIPYYKQSLATQLGLIEDKPNYGNKFEIFQQLQGDRVHGGSVTVLCEPYTSNYWLDMFATLTATSGSAPTVKRTFSLSNTTDPNFYTFDLNLVSQVVRFYGVGASKLGINWADGEAQWEADLSALGSFYGREIASIAAQVVTLTTTYDTNPTKGLVVGDLIAIKSTDGTRNLNTLVISALTATTVTVTGTITSAVAGDMLVLRPNSALALNVTTPFLFNTTQYKFGTTITTARAATHTPLETGTSIDLMHSFNNGDGESRSGSFDPASLIRTTGKYAYKTKQYFDNPDQYKIFHAISKQAGVAQHNSGTSLLEVLMNNFKISKLGQPTSFADVIYQELEYGPQYDQTDGTGMSVELTSPLVTL